MIVRSGRNGVDGPVRQGNELLSAPRIVAARLRLSSEIQPSAVGKPTCSARLVLRGRRESSTCGYEVGNGEMQNLG